MNTICAFLNRCETYRARRGIKRTYLSRLLFDDGKVLDALENDQADITVRRLTRAEKVLGEFERALSREAAPPGEGAVA